MKICHIVLTGGPCAGKTTALSKINEFASGFGYKVISVPETATEIISAGIAPGPLMSVDDFQRLLMSMQLDKYRLYNKAAEMIGGKTLVVHDRGLLDSKAYMSLQAWQELLQQFNKTEAGIWEMYNAVFHLVTAAKGAEQAYTTANNTARSESAQKARELDGKTLSAWNGHPHLRCIDNSTDFNGKIMRLLAELSVVLGVPEPREIERKFLIEKPNLAQLALQSNCTQVDIIQIYLHGKNSEERRIRRRAYKNGASYTLTSKKAVGGSERTEIERSITSKEFDELLIQADPNCEPIRKKRYCLMWNNRYYEIDVYPTAQNAIMEIELTSAGERFEIPPGIKIIKEVTTEKGFSNAHIARHGMPGELSGEKRTEYGKTT